MPNPFTFQPISYPGSSLLVNETKGWNNRTIYSFYGSPGAIYDYYDDTGGDYTQDLFNQIRGYTFPNNLTSVCYKGANKFTPRYFSTGKNILIKGRLFVSFDVNTDPTFNIRIGISSPTYGNYVIAGTNGFDNHKPDSIATDLPVDFEIMLTSIESYALDKDTNTEYYNIYMQANGAMTYCIDQGSSSNSHVVYVPIYGDVASGYGPYGIHPIADMYSDDYTRITLDFADSSRINPLKVAYLLMQEIE